MAAPTDIVPAALERENGQSDRALSRRSQTQRVDAAAAFVAGTFRLHQRRRSAMDRAKSSSCSRSTFSSWSRSIRCFARSRRGKNISRLPHLELRDGRKLCACAKNWPQPRTFRLHHDGHERRSRSAPTEITASSLSNASPVAARRRSAWSMMSCTKTCQRHFVPLMFSLVTRHPSRHHCSPPARAAIDFQEHRTRRLHERHRVLPEERRLRGAEEGAHDEAARTSSNEVKKSGLRGRGGAGFPVRREVGLHQARRDRSRSISSATPTSPSPAPSRTATSSTRIRTS